jgi:hypothetical protein
MTRDEVVATTRSEPFTVHRHPDRESLFWPYKSETTKARQVMFVIKDGKVIAIPAGCNLTTFFGDTERPMRRRRSCIRAA